MTARPDDSELLPSQRLAAILGLPEPAPLTEEQERAFREKMRRTDDEVAAIIARRKRRAA
ncbi:hypothetical protein AB0G04_10950 [Actinoplanes sp. NPDC023801]|uniref:hypothetical protein n=1 Tax=Actinoplanes sp. NPDC023801 TaxID=3154595 RepID=UPI0033F14F5A